MLSPSSADDTRHTMNHEETLPMSPIPIQTWVPIQQQGIRVIPVVGETITLPNALNHAEQIDVVDGDFVQLNDDDNHLYGWRAADLQARYTLQS